VKKPVLPKHLMDVEAIELIWGPPAVIRDVSEFRDYQTWMGRKAQELEGVYLAADPGLGKTSATLLAITEMLAAGTVRQVLVVAPLYVAENTWPEEIAGWSFARHLKYRVVTGTAAQREAALKYGPCQVTIINRENLRWLYNRFGARRWPYDLVVYDEASRLNSGRKKTKPVKRKDGSVGVARATELGILSRVRHKMRVIELSGTPASSGLINLWGPIYLIDKGYRLGRNKSDFESRWFKTNTYDYSVTPFAHSEAEIMDRIKDVFFALREKDYLDLPPLITVDHRVDLPPAVSRQYKDLERESAIILRDGARDETIIKAANEGVLTGKLSQIANGAIYDEARGVHQMHSAKLDVLASIVEEAQGQPILCAYTFQFDLAAIRKRFPQARVFGESPSDMRDWNAGRIPLLVGHCASFGHGLNFQHASNIMVWYGLPWWAELYLQFIKRLHRSGQKADHVVMHRILARGTVDETIVRVLSQREAAQDRIIDAVKVRLSRVATGQNPLPVDEVEALI